MWWRRRCLAADRHNEITWFVDWNESHKYKLVPQKKIMILIDIRMFIGIFLGTVLTAILAILLCMSTLERACNYVELIDAFVIMNEFDEWWS